MNKLISAFFLALIVVSVASSQEKWKKIENDSFSFSLPESFKKTDARGIDSFVEKYDGGSIVIVFDYGMYSNNFQDWSDKTKYEYLKVDGKDARIGVAKEEHRDGFPYSTQVHFVLGKYTKLSMFAACKSESDVSIARRIFESIAFKTKDKAK